MSAGFRHACDYGRLTTINILLKKDKFSQVRNMICEKTPFGELLKIEKQSMQRYVALNAINSCNGKKLVIRSNEFEIDSKLVNKSLNLSITGDINIEPRNENEVPVFITQEIPQLRRNNRDFHSRVIAKFQAKDDAEVIDMLEVKKLSKLYIALLFPALLFPKRQRIPFEYFYLLDDDHFENLKLYRFDIEVAKFLREGIMTAKNAQICKETTVSGCLHIVESLYPEEKLPMIHIQNKREREEGETEQLLDEPVPALKRTRSSTRNCSEDYPLEKEPQSGKCEIEYIEIEDDGSEEDDVNDEDYDVEKEEVTDDEVQVKQVPNSFMSVKRETVEKATSSVENMGAGQYFKGQHSCDFVIIDDAKCEHVEGFSVPKTQAKLYKEIWLKHGHIASSKVLKDSCAQVSVVSRILATIAAMNNCRFSYLTSETIADWEEDIRSAEKVEFNIQWVRDWLESLKKRFFEMEKLEAEMIQQEDLLKAEKKKCVTLKNALKQAEDNVSALQAKMNPLIDERRKYEEKVSMFTL